MIIAMAGAAHPALYVGAAGLQDAQPDSIAVHAPAKNLHLRCAIPLIMICIIAAAAGIAHPVLLLQLTSKILERKRCPKFPD